MRNARRSTMIGLLLCAVLVVTSNSWAQTRPPIFEKVAKTYGLDSWDKIEAIRYTWNLQLGKLECRPLMGMGAEDHPGHL